MSLINMEFQELSLFFVQYLTSNDLFGQTEMFSIVSRYTIMHDKYIIIISIFFYVTILKFGLRFIE